MTRFRNVLVIAGLALAIAVTAGRAYAGYAGTSPTPPVSQCSDFACER